MAAQQQTDNKGFPDQFVDPKIKQTDAYGLRYAKAIWDSYISHLPSFTNWYSRAIVLRKYAEGMQSADKYKARFLQRALNQEGGMGDTSYLNLDYTPINRIATIIDIAVGILCNPQRRIQLDAIDPTSRRRQQDDRDEMMAKMLLAPYAEQFEKVTGLPLIPPGEKLPKNDEEFEFHFQMNYVQDVCIAMEEILEVVLNNNSFAQVQKAKVFRDLLVLKRACVRHYYDKNFNICVEYVDPVRVITPYTDKDNFENIPYFAIRKQFTIQAIAQMGKFTEAQLRDMAAEYAGKNNNPVWNMNFQNWATSYEGYYSNMYAQRPYDSFMIDVLYFELRTVNIETVQYYNGENGQRDVKEKPFGYKPEKDRPDKPVEQQQIERFYGGMWVISSKDYIFDYKELKNVPRQSEGGALSARGYGLSLVMCAPNIYDMENKSHVERMKPHEDQLNLIQLKSQQFLLKARPPGLAVNLDATEALVNGMGNPETARLDPLNISKAYDELGSYLFRQYDESQRTLTAPVIELKNGLSDSFQQLYIAFNNEVDKMNLVVGFNSAVDATTPSSEALVGIQKMSAQSTNHSLHTLNVAFYDIYTRMALGVVLRVQDSIEDNRDSFERSVGRYSVKAIEMMDKLAPCEFGLKMELSPDEEERYQIYTQVNNALAKGTIKFSAAIACFTMLKTNTKAAGQMLGYYERKMTEEQAEIANANAEANAKQAQVATETAAAAEAQRIAQQLQADKDLEAFKSALEREKMADAHRYTMAEIAEKNKGLIVTKQVHNEGAIEVQHVKNDGSHTTEILRQNAPEPQTVA
jgi:hypothetical protein